MRVLRRLQYRSKGSRVVISGEGIETAVEARALVERRDTKYQIENDQEVHVHRLTEKRAFNRSKPKSRRPLAGAWGAWGPGRARESNRGCGKDLLSGAKVEHVGPVADDKQEPSCSSMPMGVYASWPAFGHQGAEFLATRSIRIQAA